MDCKLDNKSFNDLEHDIELIAIRYFDCLEKLTKNLKHKDAYATFVKRVKEAYDKLDMLEQRMINNEFFYQDYPDWWRNVYSKSTFYRIKKTSMLHFLEAFNGEQ